MPDTQEYVLPLELDAPAFTLGSLDQPVAERLSLGLDLLDAPFAFSWSDTATSLSSLSGRLMGGTMPSRRVVLRPGGVGRCP